MKLRRSCLLPSTGRTGLAVSHFLSISVRMGSDSGIHMIVVKVAWRPLIEAPITETWLSELIK